MSVLKRLGYYLIGLSIGLVFVSFFFKEKKTEFCYMPNCRVLKNLRSKPIKIQENLRSKSQHDSLITNRVKQALEEGEVNFSKSTTENVANKTYIIEYQNHELAIKNYDSFVVLERIEAIGKVR